MHFLVKCQKQQFALGWHRCPATRSRWVEPCVSLSTRTRTRAWYNSRPINKSIKPIKQGTWHSRELTLHYSQCNFEKNVSTRNGCDSANVNVNVAVNVNTCAMAHMGALHCLRLWAARRGVSWEGTSSLRALCAGVYVGVGVGVAAAPFACRCLPSRWTFIISYFLHLLKKMWKIKNIVLYACIYVYTKFVSLHLFFLYILPVLLLCIFPTTHLESSSSA